MNTQRLPCVLVIDDEEQIRKFLRISLTANGYRVLEAGTGREGLQRAQQHQPELLILDLGLPDMDGKEVLDQLRAWSSVPVLVLSVRASDSEKVLCLDGGANDYVTKPFSIPEFLARVRVLLRPNHHRLRPNTQVHCGALQIDLQGRHVRLNGHDIALTPKEYDVLATLARQPGGVVTQHQLLRDIWGPTHLEDSHYLRVVVGHLRQKLGDNPANPRFILTEAGIGYRLREHPSGVSP